MSATGDRNPVDARDAKGETRREETIMNGQSQRRGRAAAACLFMITAAGLGAVWGPASGTALDAGPVVQENAPAAGLALEVRPVWPTVYAGGPFAVRARITSPRAQQDSYRELLALEEGAKPRTSTFKAPSVREGWAEKVVFTVKRVQPDGSTRPVLEGLDWTACLVLLAEDQGPDPAGAGTGPREWNVGPEAAPLAEGDYRLQASWKGPEGTLTASETRFTVKPAATWDEKAEHARRLAKFEFGRGRYQEALAQATAVINADPPFTPEIAETFMIAAASQAGLKNWRAAADTYKKLIAWLPAHSDLTELVKDMLKYVEEKAAAPGR